MASTNADITATLSDDEVTTLTDLLRRVTIATDGPDTPMTSGWRTPGG